MVLRLKVQVTTPGSRFSSLSFRYHSSQLYWSLGAVKITFDRLTSWKTQKEIFLTPWEATGMRLMNCRLYSSISPLTLAVSSVSNCFSLMAMSFQSVLSASTSSNLCAFFLPLRTCIIGFSGHHNPAWLPSYICEDPVPRKTISWSFKSTWTFQTHFNPF